MHRQMKVAAKLDGLARMAGTLITPQFAVEETERVLAQERLDRAAATGLIARAQAERDRKNKRRRMEAA